MDGIHNLQAKLLVYILFCGTDIYKNKAGTTVFVLFWRAYKKNLGRGHITCAMFVCPSSCMHVTNWEPR